MRALAELVVCLVASYLWVALVAAAYTLGPGAIAIALAVPALPMLVLCWRNA